MGNSKRWWQSKTILSGLIGALAGLWYALQPVIPMLPDIPPLILTVLEILGFGGVVVGRIDAGRTGTAIGGK